MLTPGRALHQGGARLGPLLTGNSHCSFYSTEVPANVPEPRVSSKLVSQFKKGAGGRASFSGNVVTVFGSTGWLGSSVVNRMARQGNQMIIPYRCDPYWVRELKTVGDLGQMLFFPFNLKDEEAIRRTMKYSNIVINLIGTRVHTSNFSMHDTHVEGARRIARIAREMGVERLIHVSAMNADPDYQPRYVKNAQFLKTKGLGEVAVREEFPSATIIRPAVIYGESDKFIYPLLSYWRLNFFTNWISLYKAGEQSYKMPIFKSDVANGIVKAATDPTAVGKTYEFVGPHCYKFSELVDFMYAKARVKGNPLFTYGRHGYFDPMLWANGVACRLYTKLTNRMSSINYEWMEFAEVSSDILTGAPTLADLGIHRLTEFEVVGGHHAFLQNFIRSYREKLEDLEDPPLPLRSPPLYKNKPQYISMGEIKTESRPFGLPIASSVPK